MDPDTIEMINSLHTGSWFGIGGLDTVIVAARARRQGCKLGAVVFNMIYGKALKQLRDRLREHVIIKKLKIKINDQIPVCCKIPEDVTRRKLWRQHVWTMNASYYSQAHRWL